jgi:hypothetical protein
MRVAKSTLDIGSSFDTLDHCGERVVFPTFANDRRTSDQVNVNPPFHGDGSARITIFHDPVLRIALDVDK